MKEGPTTGIQSELIVKIKTKQQQQQQKQSFKKRHPVRLGNLSKAPERILNVNVKISRKRSEMSPFCAPGMVQPWNGLGDPSAPGPCVPSRVAFTVSFPATEHAQGPWG